MNAASLRDVLEATRLTRSGRLTEATALLQRVLQGHMAPPGEHPSGKREPPTIDGVVVEPAETVEVRRHARLASGSGAAQQSASRAAGGRTHAAMPEALRSFIDQATSGTFQPLSGGMVRPLPAETPVAVADGALFLSATFMNQTGSRPYKLYIPSSYCGEPVPLIVMLHGCTQSPDDFAAGTRMNAAAEEHACLVVYPGQTVAANSSKCWNWFSAGDQGRDRGEPSLLAGITREVMRQYAVDPRRIYVAGLSAGGAAAAIMGSTYPDLFAAVGVHSGLACGAAQDLPSAFAAMRQGGGGPTYRPGTASREVRCRPVPTIVFHGDRDTTVHPLNGDSVIAHSMPETPLDRRVTEGRVSGGHAYSVTTHADANGKVVLEQWVVHGAGHKWFGGSPAGSYTDPRGPDATREMLRFFLQHENDCGQGP
ncbi:extracellular catalytic domain type 1 short-chain-length polyhydroxyalkanoate depolymerase [Limobrevibacterium gyesilva]|uniref:PHB depolymerase family esterase n=1 Tax=Limobrevibacterium gyesilva TaxID=2991712 RepID=A0AA42CHP4_9PROT|nr:PHB depolymerase family esterase [Limobrevibacterium gyesilva]MCW3477466.1 PHB depolymerase family esterase [Limobrevibacterium gyesilva]